MIVFIACPLGGESFCSMKEKEKVLGVVRVPSCSGCHFPPPGQYHTAHFLATFSNPLCECPVEFAKKNPEKGSDSPSDVALRGSYPLASTWRTFTKFSNLSGCTLVISILLCLSQISQCACHRSLDRVPASP